MKFCKDCVHFTLPYPSADQTIGLCKKKTNTQDPVTGNFDGHNPHPFCRVERVTITGNCGREARFFSPKEVPNA